MQDKRKSKNVNGAGTPGEGSPAPALDSHEPEASSLYHDMDAEVDRLIAHLQTVFPDPQDKEWCILASAFIYAVGLGDMCRRAIAQPPDLTRECLPFFIGCYASGEVVPSDPEAADRVFTIRAELGLLTSAEAGIHIAEAGRAQ